jgi:deoxycytidylate deaminase
MSISIDPPGELHDIVVGIVAPIGTDLDRFCSVLKLAFDRLGYSPEVVTLSGLLNEVKDDFSLDLSHNDEIERCNKFMSAGNRFRECLNRGDALSMLAVGAIREIRHKSTHQKHAFILRTLKHPSEVESLRKIYGPAFVLFSLASCRSARVKYLAKRICKSQHNFDSTNFLPDAENLIIKDQQEPDNKYGQKVGKLFHLADFFIDVDNDMDGAVRRLTELFLGNVFITPTRSEQGMFIAHASAWRSASLQRQVGVVIATRDGGIISVGTNEVPKFGGGLYWEGDDPDFRDFQRGDEINDDMKHRMLVEVIQKLSDRGMTFQDGINGEKHELADSKDPLKIANWLVDKGHLENTRIMSIIEFGRCVHAEMAALMDAARRGVSVDGCYLYTTTFPCHECARHIVAAGVRKVYYTEPYPKSLVNELYPDSIRIEERESDEYLSFIPFVGVAPRRYQDLFKLGNIDRKTLIEHANSWHLANAKPRLGDYPARTVLINGIMETLEFNSFVQQLEKAKKRNDRT